MVSSHLHEGFDPDRAESLRKFLDYWIPKFMTSPKTFLVLSLDLDFLESAQETGVKIEWLLKNLEMGVANFPIPTAAKVGVIDMEEVKLEAIVFALEYAVERVKAMKEGEGK